MRRLRKQIFQNQRDGAGPGTGSSYRKKENPQQRQRDPNRANQQIFPRRLKRAMMSMEVNQRSTGQGCCLDSHPKKSQVLAKRDQRHRGKKEKQATREARFTRIGKKKSLLEIRVRLTAFFAQ